MTNCTASPNCTFDALPDETVCWPHASTEIQRAAEQRALIGPDMGRCPAFTKGNRQCRGTARPSDGLCNVHTPQPVSRRDIRMAAWHEANAATESDAEEGPDPKNA